MMNNESIDNLNESLKKVPVWDIWIRISHWALLILISLCYYTAEIGGLNFRIPILDVVIINMEIHLISGLLILVILIFRILWGFFGSDTSSFLMMVKSAKLSLSYIRKLHKKKTQLHIGHNPTGAISVFVIIFVLFIQAASGLFSQDDSFFPTQGPLTHLISNDDSTAITKFHKLWWEYMVIFIIGIHVTASLFYLIIKKQNLIFPLFNGKKTLPINADYKTLKFGSTRLALTLLLIAFSTIIIIANSEKLQDAFLILAS